MVDVYDVERNGAVVASGIAGPPHVSGDLTPGTEYTFRVRARNNQGVGPWSGPLIVTTDSPTPGINFLENFSYSNGSFASVASANWTAPRTTSGGALPDGPRDIVVGGGSVYADISPLTVTTGTGYAVEDTVDTAAWNLDQLFYVQASINIGDWSSVDVTGGRSYTREAGIGWRCDGTGITSGPYPGLFASVRRRRSGSANDLFLRLEIYDGTSLYDDPEAGIGVTSLLVDLGTPVTSGVLRIVDQPVAATHAVRLDVYWNSTLIVTRWTDDTGLSKQPGIGRMSYTYTSDTAGPPACAVDYLAIATDEGDLP